MSELCSIELLESALAGSLPPDKEEMLQQHLDECESCSAAIERLAGCDAFCKEAAVLLTEDAMDQAATREDWSAVDFGIEFLDSVDEPSVLGSLGGYHVLEIIGRGGMGFVLKGFDLELRRYVAIKALAPHLAQSPLARKRFAREAQAAAAIVHPHVVAIHHVQSNGRLPFLIIHGTQDPLVPFQQSKLLAAALEEAGASAALIPVEGGGHGNFRKPDGAGG